MFCSIHWQRRGNLFWSFTSDMALPVWRRKQPVLSLSIHVIYVNFQTNSNQKFFFRFHLTNRRVQRSPWNSQISKQCDVKHALLPPMNVHRFLPILCASMKQNILLNFCCHRLTISCHYIEACIILGSKGKGWGGWERQRGSSRQYKICLILKENPLKNTGKHWSGQKYACDEKEKIHWMKKTFLRHEKENIYTRSIVHLALRFLPKCIHEARNQYLIFITLRRVNIINGKRIKGRWQCKQDSSPRLFKQHPFSKSHCRHVVKKQRHCFISECHQRPKYLAQK